jgi:hypothetical protein
MRTRRRGDWNWKRQAWSKAWWACWCMVAGTGPLGAGGGVGVGSIRDYVWMDAQILVPCTRVGCSICFTQILYDPSP